MFAPLHEIIFFCVLFLFFFGVGRIFLSLLPDNLRSGVPSFYLLSVVGVAVVSMAAQCLYFGGLPIRTFAPFLFLVSCSGWGWHLVSAARRRRCGERRPVPDRRVFIRIAVLITGTLLVVLPRFTGGQQFTVFQGNHWDTFGYLEPAATYLALPHSVVRDSSMVELEAAGGFTRGHWQLDKRPSVRILYALVSVPDQKHLLGNTYLFVSYFFALAMGVGCLILDEISGEKKVRSAVAAVAVAGGFWGQYVFDINAWSSISSVPLLLASVWFLASDTNSFFEARQRQWRPVALVSIFLAGAVYLYPEGSAFFAPAMAVMVLVRCALVKSFAGLIHTGVSSLAVLALLLPVWKSTIGLIFYQAKFVYDQNVQWWVYFLNYIYGRNGPGTHPVTMPLDGLLGVLGLYYLTPAEGATVFQIVTSYVLLALLLGSLVFLIVKLGRSALMARAGVFAFAGLAITTGILLGEAAVLAVLQRWWAFGKAISYAAPLFMIVLMVPFVTVWSLPSRIFVAVGRIASGLLAIFHLGFALVRPIAAARPHGIHYALPYPAIQEPEMKIGFDWGDFEYTRPLGPDDLVAVHIEFPWVRSYVRILLLSRGIPHFITTPVTQYHISIEDLGSVEPPGVPTVTLSLELDRGKGQYFIRATRTDPALPE